MTKVSSEPVSIHMHDCLCINSEIIEKSAVTYTIRRQRQTGKLGREKLCEPQQKVLKATRRQTRQTMNIEFSEVKIKKYCTVH